MKKNAFAFLLLMACWNTAAQSQRLSPAQRREALEVASGRGGGPVEFYSAVSAALEAADRRNNPKMSEELSADMEKDGFVRPLHKPWGTPNWSVISNPNLMFASHPAMGPSFVANTKELVARYDIFVVGGVPAPEDIYPNCVAIGRDGKWFCSGLLVSPDAVLTAAHCLAEYPNTVGVGSDVASCATYKIKGLPVKHPRFSMRTYANDLAILRLETAVPKFQRERIANKDETDGSPVLRLVGFGQTNAAGGFGYGVKRMVDIPVVANSCYEPVQVSDTGCNMGIEIVAGRPLLGRDQCAGDSGGPTYVMINGRSVPAAIVSRRADNAPQRCGDGGIYVRLHPYAEWIAGVVGN